MNRIHNTLMAVAVSALSLLSVEAQRVEYFWDTDPGVGKGRVLQGFTGSSATINTELDVSSLPSGIHSLGLRSLNGAHFSATYYRFFYVPVQEEAITRIEYYWDKNPGIGNGRALSFTKGSTVDLAQSLSVSGLTAGMHTLYLRALSTKHFSQTYTRSFYIPPVVHKVEAIEYWFDDDPGVGKATRMAATLTGDSLTKAFDVNTDGLDDGVHHIGIRTLTDGTWSATKVQQFLVRSQVENYVTRLEYFWNDDPGQGRGYAVDITPGEEVSIDFEADMTMLGEGPHTLGLRAQTGSRGWSPVEYVSGIEFEGWDNLQEYLDSFEDTQDVLTGTTYTRQFKNRDWHALYVPFSMSYSDWSAHFEVARINAFYQYDDDDDGVVDRQVLEAILVKPSNGSLKPNYPYLIRARQNGTYHFNIDASKRVAEEINSVSCSTMEARYTFTGNYSDMTGLKSAERYRLRGTSLSIPESDDEVLPPYRWYLTIDNLGNQLQGSSSRVSVRIVGEEEATGIDSPAMLQTAESIYDLQGRKVTTGRMKKGLYIINNKKQIVK